MLPPHPVRTAYEKLSMHPEGSPCSWHCAALASLGAIPRRVLSRRGGHARRPVVGGRSLATLHARGAGTPEQIDEHQQSEKRLKQYREQLEQQVQESTAELVAVNEEELQSLDEPYEKEGLAVNCAEKISRLAGS